MIDQDSLYIIAEFLGKSAILVALGFAFVVVFRRVSPAVKHTLLLRVFAAGLVIPLLWFAFPRWKVIPAISSGAEIAASEVMASNAESFRLETSAMPVASRDALADPGAASAYPFGWVELVFALWTLGIFLFLIRSLSAARFLTKLEKESKPASEHIRRKFVELRAVICPQRKVVLLQSSLVNSAFTWGIIRPRIVLPHSVSEWSSVDLEMVLMHELEHVRRKDALAVLISRIFLALNWVNPLAWIAVRKSVQLREEACDRSVLQSGYPGQSYAEMLFRQASVVASPIWRTPATAVAENGTIEQRIKMILNPDKETRSGINDASLISKLLPTALILIVFFVGVAGFAEGEKSIAADNETLEKMESIILPKIEFSDTPLSDAMRYFQQRSIELDPEKEGIVILDARKKGAGFSEARVTLRLSNVPLEEAIRYTTSLAQTNYSVKDGAIVVGPKSIEQMAAERESQQKEEARSLAENQRKMKKIILPSVEFNDTPLRDALSFLQLRSVELDVATKDPGKKGVNVILDAEGGNTDVRITLKLKSVPLAEVFRYTAELARAEYEVEPHAIRIFFPKGNRDNAVKSGTYSDEAKKEIAAVQKKLDEIIIPAIEFSKTPLSDALRFIQMRSAELDKSAGESGMKGINVVLDGGKEADDVRVSLKLSNVSLDKVLKYTATSAGGDIEIGPNAVVVRLTEE